MIIDRAGVRSILVIKLRAIGDILLSTVVTKNLRDAFPDARIMYLVEPPGVDVLRGNPFVDGTVVFDRRTMSGAALIAAVRHGGFDLVIDLFGNPRTALVTRLSGARYRVGYRFRGRSYAYNIVVEPRGDRVHNTRFNLDALEALGIAITDSNIYFQWAGEDESRVRRFLDEAGLSDHTLVGLNTGGGWYTKRWGLERFAALGDMLAARYGVRIVLLWGPGQREDVETVQGLMHHTPFIPPETSLSQLGALLRQLTLVVSNDSGPMHIAAAVGTPVLGIYGPTNPALQGPYGDRHVVVRREGLDCLGCNRTQCPIGHPCMLTLEVDTVMQGILALCERNAISLPPRN